MRTDPPVESCRESAFVLKDQLETMDGCCNKLGNLAVSQVPLPADVLLVARTHRGQEVVKVHYDMDQRIEQGKEAGVAAGSKADSRPQADRHDPMMDQMKQCYLLVLLTQYEEEGIEKVDKL